MIAVIQRVTSGCVSIAGRKHCEILRGYVILLGVCKEDKDIDASHLADKITSLRIMSDKAGKMNLSIEQTKGEILVVPQFTLCADLSGRRPSFSNAKEPIEAKRLYSIFVEELEKKVPVKTGEFAAMMEVSLVNDGPVTFILI